LVALTRNQTLRDNPALVCAFVKATVDGYRSATANPDQDAGVPRPDHPDHPLPGVPPAER
jgi:hypothetical protein